MRLSRLVSAFALLLAASLSLVPSVSAQISADRPGFGDGTTTVAPGTFQAELGYAPRTPVRQGLDRFVAWLEERRAA